MTTIIMLHSIYMIFQYYISIWVRCGCQDMLRKTWSY